MFVTIAKGMQCSLNILSINDFATILTVIRCFRAIKFAYFVNLSTTTRIILLCSEVGSLNKVHALSIQKEQFCIQTNQLDRLFGTDHSGVLYGDWRYVVLALRYPNPPPKSLSLFKFFIKSSPPLITSILAPKFSSVFLFFLFLMDGNQKGKEGNEASLQIQGEEEGPGAGGRHRDLGLGERSWMPVEVVVWLGDIVSRAVWRAV
jgi:hypothetical protein